MHTFVDIYRSYHTKPKTPRMQLLPIFLQVLSAYAVIPESHVQKLGKSQPPRLPNLVKLNSLNELSPDWSVKGNMVLEEGRLIVKDGSGSIWSRDALSNTKDDWTIEVVFRNSENVEVEDHLYFDSNGFSFWLIESNLPQNSENFGGPKSYEGFQFLFNNKEGRGLKIFANDGTKAPQNSKADALGECDINYLDSLIPFTLRLSYSGQNKVFKVQVDNNLCFRTEKISLANVKNDFIFGVSASVDAKSQEYWELIKLDSYNEVTEDAIDDHDLIKEGLVQMVTVTQTDDSQPTEHSNAEQPNFNRKSLMEKTNDGGSSVDFSQVSAHIVEITNKLNVLENSLGKFDNSEVSELSSALQEVKKVQSEQLAVLLDMRKTHEDFQALLRSHFKEMVSSVGVLHQKVIDEIKVHQMETHNIEDKVDLLMANHKTILKQYMEYAGEMKGKNDSSEFFSVVVKWVSLPFFILMAGLSLLVYRLRKDIKHSKII